MLFTFSAANDRERIIKCDGGSEILLKIGSTNATMHCHLNKWSSNINISLTKTFSSCLLENSSSPSLIVKDWSKNGSKIIRIMADTVTWGISGNYVLSAKASNFTLEKKFVIKVSGTLCLNGFHILLHIFTNFFEVQYI